MRLATLIETDGTTRAARVDEGDVLVALEASDVVELLNDPAWPSIALRDSADPIPLADARLAPAVRPVKVICVGLNYRAHILEMGRDLPEYPTLFPKFPDALTGPYEDIPLDPACTTWDYEVELGIVLGQPVGRHVDEGTAAQAIAGYTVVNDITAREWQNRTLQWLQGKSWDASTPVGPWITTVDELTGADPGHPDLEVTCSVNGEVRQRAHTTDLVFSPPELVAYVSKFTSLSPGDLIATGTPAGVSAGNSAIPFLADGDVVVTAIEGLGECVNTCVGPRKTQQP